MNSTALLYALGTVVTWGLYSVLLHKGSMAMAIPGAPDFLGSRMKSFLFVGVAYLIVGIVGPLIIMKLKGTPWVFPTAGWAWSLVAGLAGAIGAFFLLMALSAGHTPAESKLLPLLVPAIVFSGAPIVNAIVSITKDSLWSRTPPQFYLGILLAGAGAALVMKYRPMAGPAPASATKPEAKAVSAAVAVPASAPVSVSTATARPGGFADVTTRVYFVS
ncbi:MAG: hypothetical protein JWM59_2873 [Verrucomicrobiales bacterium]|nr:hypothetical protein [Verrucomicrobiales bacterium]